MGWQVNNCCITEREPCHIDDCAGFNEVVSLLPTGELWNPDRQSIYGQYIRALGHIKTELNRVLCSMADTAPCSSAWMFNYWSKVYKLPDCVEQTPEKLCEWLDILFDDCPIGSLGFLRKAIHFVNPDLSIDFILNVPDGFANGWRSDDWFCANKNMLVIKTEAKHFRYHNVEGDYPHELADGKNACRRYFIPEVECLRPCIFPMGLSVGYQTTETGDYDINNWGIIPEGERPKSSLICDCTGALK